MIQANKQAGASGLNRILGAITGAGLGYYGGQMVPGVAQSGFKGIPGANKFRTNHPVLIIRPTLINFDLEKRV